MFLRSTNRKKDGKDHRYFSVVENQRVAANKTVQRTVLYLGEINDAQQAAWRKTMDVFDEDQQDYRNLSLFPEDREIPADAVDSLQVRLSGLELRVETASPVWELLAGQRNLAATGPDRVLANAPAGRARSGELGEGAAIARGQSVDRAGQ